MRIVLYDGIQEAHVANSLERALVAAGHEVYNTGRFGRGFIFRDTDDLLPLVGPQLEAIAAFRPDWVLVFRPGSAPYPILQSLRSTGARLAVWLSDDPVLFDLTYGPVLDLYDLVLHCGNAAVLGFYEDRCGRPTGVNFPFWTDHEAFPAVYGTREPETTALFLGNVAGPVRRTRYEQLARMRHPVRIFGQVGEDPAGLWGGFLDTDREVVEAGSRTRVALNIPQFFADHRGLKTWFPGLDELGYFDLPSRVIQYAAMGIPTVSIVPGVAGIPSFPELVVVDSIQAADEWIGTALAEGTLEDLGRRTAERFDRSFSAAARVRALESLFADDGWRALDAAERAVWFLRFDGRGAEPALPAPAEVPGPTGPAGQPPALRGPWDSAADAGPAKDGAADGTGVERVDSSQVLVLHGREAERFSPVDVLVRELGSTGRPPTVWGPERLGPFLSRAERPFQGVVDAGALLESLGELRPRFLVLAEGLLLSGPGAEHLRRAGLACLLLLREEPLTPEHAAPYDLVVRVGPAPVDRVALLRGEPHAVHSPGLVESGFLEAVRARDGRAAVAGRASVVRSGADPVADWALGALPDPDDAGADAAAACDVSPADLADADLETLAEVLSRDLVYLQPVEQGTRQLHQPVTPYAVCAAGTVVTTRHRTSRFPDLYGPWLTKAASPAEAALKVDRLGPGTAAGQREARRRSLDARSQWARWFAMAAAAPAALLPDRPTVLADAGDTLLRLDHRYPLDTVVAGLTSGETVDVRLALADSSLVGGLRVLHGERTVAQTRFAAGTAAAVLITLTGSGKQAVERAGEQVSVEFLGAAGHRLRASASVRVATTIRPGARVYGTAPEAPVGAWVMPVPIPPDAHRLSWTTGPGED